MLNGRILQHLVLAGTLLLAPLLHAASLPDFEAVYIVKRGGLRIGTTSIALTTASDNRYLYETRSTPTRLVSWFLTERLHETSRGTLNAAGVRPDEYRYQRSGGNRDRTVDLVFDWQDMTVENRVGDSNWKM